MFSLQDVQCTVGTASSMVAIGVAPSVGSGERVPDVALMRWRPGAWPRKRRRRRLLVTTNTLENAIAAPASIGLSRPAAASGRAATL